MELFNALGVNIKILVAQFLNFAVLVFILYKFGYKPILKIIDERQKKIEEGINNTHKTREKLEEIALEKKEVIQAARAEAQLIIEKARVQAENKQKEMISRAKEEIGQVINQEKAKIRQEKAESLKQIRQEISSLVLIALDKVLGEKIDDKKDKDIIQKAVKSLK